MERWTIWWQKEITKIIKTAKWGTSHQIFFLKKYEPFQCCAWEWIQLLETKSSQFISLFQVKIRYFSFSDLNPELYYKSRVCQRHRFCKIIVYVTPWNEGELQNRMTLNINCQSFSYYYYYYYHQLFFQIKNVKFTFEKKT